MARAGVIRCWRGRRTITGRGSLAPGTFRLGSSVHSPIARTGIGLHRLALGLPLGVDAQEVRQRRLITQQHAELEQRRLATPHLRQADQLCRPARRLDDDLVRRQRPVAGAEQQPRHGLTRGAQRGDVRTGLGDVYAPSADPQTRQSRNERLTKPAVGLGDIARNVRGWHGDRAAEHPLGVEQKRPAAGATCNHVNSTCGRAFEVDDARQAVMQAQTDHHRGAVGEPESRAERRAGLVQQGLVRGDGLACWHSVKRAQRDAHDSLTNVTWRGSRISVVFPTYNERDSIRAAILDFAALEVVDEILVINNNAAPGTSEQVAAAIAQLPNRTLVREIHEPRQGYGFAIQRGLREANGDYIVVSEPDGTFLGRDTFKLLAYVEDFDVVYGSRTARTFIWRGANMGAWLRWGNWGVAKLMEFLFNSTNLTDVGCTMRLIRREALGRMEGKFTIGGSAFGPEMMLLSLLLQLRVIQVPVNYLPRIGVSSVTGDVRKAVLLGFSMIGLVLRYRMKAWLGTAPRARPALAREPREVALRR